MNVSKVAKIWIDYQKAHSKKKIRYDHISPSLTGSARISVIVGEKRQGEAGCVVKTRNARVFFMLAPGGCSGVIHFFKNIINLERDACTK
jgi:hypothetical protein